MSGKTYKDRFGNVKYADSDKPVARIAAAKKLGRPLKQEEVVHHKDRNKSNNSAGNLWVFRNQGEHDKIHKKDAKKYGKKASYSGF